MACEGRKRRPPLYGGKPPMSIVSGKNNSANNSPIEFSQVHSAETGVCLRNPKARLQMLRLTKGSNPQRRKKMKMQPAQKEMHRKKKKVQKKKKKANQTKKETKTKKMKRKMEQEKKK